MKKVINSPHDKFFRNSFADIESAVGFFKHYLPKEISSQLDFHTLAIDNTTFVDAALQEYRSDLLYQVKLNNGIELGIYLLFEHQSTPDPLMMLRLLGYMVKVWEYLVEKKKSKALIPILPFILSQSPWPYSPRFQDWLVLDEGTRTIFSPWLPDFTHLLLDLSNTSLEDVQEPVYIKIALHLLKSGRQGRLIEALEHLSPLLRELADRDTALGLIETLLRYATQVGEDVTVDKLRELVVKHLNEAAGDKVMTIVDQIKQEVEAKYRPEMEQLRREKDQILREKEELLAQLKAAGIEPKTKQ